MTKKVDYLIARLKAKQSIRKVKEARQAREMEKMNNVSTAIPNGNEPATPPPPNQSSGLGGDNGAGLEP